MPLERVKDCFKQNRFPDTPNFFGRALYPTSGLPQIGCQAGEQIGEHASTEHDLIYSEAYSVGGCNKRPNTDEIKEGIAGSGSDFQPFPLGTDATGDRKLQDPEQTRNATKDQICNAAAQTIDTDLSDSIKGVFAPLKGTECSQ